MIEARAWYRLKFTALNVMSQNQADFLVLQLHPQLISTVTAIPTLSKDSDLLQSEGFDFQLSSCSAQTPLKPHKIQMGGIPTTSPVQHSKWDSIVPKRVKYRGI